MTFLPPLSTYNLNAHMTYSKEDYLSVTYDVSLWPTRYPTFAGVSVGTSEDVPEFGNDGLLSERMVVLRAQGKVANETHQSLEEERWQVY